MNIYIDIETIPGQAPWIKEDIAANIAPPGNMKKAETIEKWEKEDKPGLIEEAWRKTALNGTLGEIICIGYAVDDNDPVMTARGLMESEADMLIHFYAKLVKSLTDKNDFVRRPTWIGHYITGFDLRFIWQRSVIHGVKPPVEIPVNAKPWADFVFDTKTEWSGYNQYNSSSSLDMVSRVLGFDGKGDMDGSKVWDTVLAGDLDSVIKYCAKDVTDVRKVYKRLTFQG